MKIKYLTACYGLLVTLCALSMGAGASTISAGDLVVSELLANPAAVSDSRGEWLELYNTSDQAIDLNGLVLQDQGSNRHTIAQAGPLVILPGEYLVLGRDGDSSTNGGYEADYVYSNFSLANSSDAVILAWQGETIFSLFYASSDGFGQAGTSMELQGLAPHIHSGLYGPATAAFGAGDLGTPGTGSLDTGVSEVPLPAAAWLFGASLSLLAGIKRRQ